MAETKITPDEVKTKYQTFVPPSITIIANAFTQLQAITLPATTVPHVYLVISSIEYANGNGAASNEFAQRIMNGAGSQVSILYHDCHTGAYFTSSTLNYPIVSSGETINIQVYSQAASRGTTNRGNITVVDLGAA